eukprot:COSAG01_NODE_4439_length_5022_cov_8.812919_2_plen_95_part_00
MSCPRCLLQMAIHVVLALVRGKLRKAWSTRWVLMKPATMKMKAMVNGTEVEAVASVLQRTRATMHGKNQHDNNIYLIIHTGSSRPLSNAMHVCM